GSIGIQPGESQTITVIYTAPTATPTVLSVPIEYATIQEAIDAAQEHTFFDSIDISSDDPYAAQANNGSVSGSIYFEGDVVAVEPGTYVENLLIQDRNVHLLCDGELGAAVIDGNQAGSCVTFEYTAEFWSTYLSSSIRGFTIQNGDAYRGGGINTNAGNVTIEGNTIQNNHATDGGGLSTYNASGRVVRNLIINNSAEVRGGGVRSHRSGMVFENNTIWGNSALSGYAGVFSTQSSYPVINSIIWGNGDDTLQVNGSTEIVYSTLSSSWPGAGNITADPLFVDSDGGDFQLQAASPCVNAATAFFVYREDTLISLDTTDYLGLAPDIGALESSHTVAVIDHPVLPVRFTLYQNYPNPFNPITTVRYEVARRAEVKLIVFDLLGREVARLVDGQKEPGAHQITWNSREIPSGIYIARMVTPGYSKSIKMMLLK
ncbi:T9SS type A sorting domain-containing protein, partial [Candidatus Neomarinimicrobiota bacterium]